MIDISVEKMILAIIYKINENDREFPNINKLKLSSMRNYSNISSYLKYLMISIS